MDIYEQNGMPSQVKEWEQDEKRLFVDLVLTMLTKEAMR